VNKLLNPAYWARALSHPLVLLGLLVDLLPIYGVIAWGWNAVPLVMLYWMENVVAGVMTIPRLVISGASYGGVGLLAGSGLSLFFLFHYGMFWLVHGIFVFALPTFAGGSLGGGALGDGAFGDGAFGGGGGADICLDPGGFPIDCAGGAFGEVIWSSVLIGAVALFLSHGASFLLNYIGRGEYLTANPGGQMARVYGRVVVLHLTIIFGAFVVAFLGSPIGALLVLVVLKTAFDLGLHLRERRGAAPLMASAAPSW
jgi:hypothetical protein